MHMQPTPATLRVAGVNYDSLADGEGVRAAIFFSGCSHHCPGCHNLKAQDSQYGVVVTPELIQTVAAEINKRPYLSGITLTGGDPLFHALQTTEFLRKLLAMLDRPLTVWLYTGYVWEKVSRLNIFDMVDIVVDGPFVQELADKRLPFRGSVNQRIIDVRKSKESASVVLYNGCQTGR